jgi:hypothetical protein
MLETYEQFCERMSHVEKTDELIVGPRHAGNTRTIFNFEGHHCFLETFNLPDYSQRAWREVPPVVACLNAVMNPPSSHWVYAPFFYGKRRAKMLEKHYHAKQIEEDPYPKEGQDGKWFSLVFGTFEELIRLIYDIRTGKFAEQFGDEESVQRYESCLDE